MSEAFKLALVQMLVEGGNRAANLRRAAQLVDEAAAQGAKVVVLPEAMTLGWTHPSARTDAEAIPTGETCSFLREIAQQHGIFLCSGLIEKDGAWIFNAAVLINPQGEIILHHRKINELDIAHDLYSRGDRLQVAHTPLGTFGMMICSDAFAAGQVISRSLGLMGAGMVLSPSSWAVPADHDQQQEPYGKLWLDNYQPVARDFRLWIAGVSNVGWITAGPWRGRKCIGCSLLIAAGGQPMVTGPYGEKAECILYHDVVLERRPAQGWE